MYNFRLFKVFYILPVLMAMSTVFCSCEEEESSMGSALVDPATLYHGIHDTVCLNGYTIYDDSLRTFDYAEALLGTFNDDALGNTSAFLYAQVAPRDDNGLNLSSQVHFDSVDITLILNNVFSSTSTTTFDAHFRIYQLQNEIDSEKKYCGNDSIPWDLQTCFLDIDTTLSIETRSIRMKLDTSKIFPLLTANLSTSDFIANMKGIRISLNEFESRDVMVSVNMNAVDTKLTLHYSKDGEVRSVPFILGNKSGLTTRHFVQFRHHYAGTPIARFGNEAQRSDTIGIAAAAYLKPMGGTRVVFKLDTAWYNRFRREHPYAVVNYAELLLPVVSGDTNTLPKRLLAYKGADGDAALVSDAIDVDRYGGFDGYLNPKTMCYRMRVVRHLQQLLTEGVDNGTTIAIDARRSNPKSVSIKGTTAADRPRIALVYNE